MMFNLIIGIIVFVIIFAYIFVIYTEDPYAFLENKYKYVQTSAILALVIAILTVLLINLARFI